MDGSNKTLKHPSHEQWVYHFHQSYLIHTNHGMHVSTWCSPLSSASSQPPSHQANTRDSHWEFEASATHTRLRITSAISNTVDYKTLWYCHNKMMGLTCAVLCFLNLLLKWMPKYCLAYIRAQLKLMSAISTTVSVPTRPSMAGKSRTHTWLTVWRWSNGWHLDCTTADHYTLWYRGVKMVGITWQIGHRQALECVARSQTWPTHGRIGCLPM